MKILVDSDSLIAYVAGGGDSVVDLLRLDGHDVEMIGYVGKTLKEMANNLQQGEWDAVVICGGGNDTFKFRSQAKIEADIVTIISHYTPLCKQIIVVPCPLSSVAAAKTRRHKLLAWWWLPKLAKTRQLTMNICQPVGVSFINRERWVMEIAEDGAHNNHHGHYGLYGDIKGSL